MLKRNYNRFDFYQLTINILKTYYCFMLTQTDLDQIEKIVEETVEEKIGEKTNLLPTKDEFFEKMDEVMGELMPYTPGV